MSEHTPGPWITDGPAQFAHRDRGSMVYAKSGNGHLVATLENDNSPNHRENARLIAAAPDLLEACRVLTDEICGLHGSHSEPLKEESWDDTGSFKAYMLARAAIAKAEGTT